ncbi:MAG: cyclic nucleotide-binding domain-containing protein [Candidatus Bathyarchaeia archaeon]
MGAHFDSRIVASSFTATVQTMNPRKLRTEALNHKLLIEFFEVLGIETLKLRRSENDAVVELLKKAPLWSGLNEKELKSMVRISKERKFESGYTILKKGEGGVGFYFILEGTVEIRSDGNTLSTLGPGQFFGEMCVLDNQPRSADVVTIQPSRVLLLTAWDFKGLISANPRIALKMLQELVGRLRNADLSLSE